MNRIKKYLAIMLALALTLGIFGGVFSWQETIKAQAADKFTKLKTGDSILFGSYEQDNIANNGKETIEWIVLSNNGKELFVVSKYGLDYKQFDDTGYGWWEDCSLRKWLNNEFYNTAFSDSDKKLIKTTKVKTKHNMGENKYYISTKDNVFLLSYKDAVNKGYGFNSKGYKIDFARRCEPTEYTLAQGIFTRDDYLTSDGELACSWWLRTKNDRTYYVKTVDFQGTVTDYGSFEYNAVRPALVLDLSAMQSGTQVEIGSKPGKPVISLKAAMDDTEVHVSIESTRGADGYLIYMKEEGDEEYNLVKDVKKDGSKLRTATITGLSTGTYSFLAESYSIVSGKTVCGGISKRKITSLITERFSDPGSFSSARTGNIIVFGSYEQDNNTENGKEAIEWIVLSNNGKELFAVSRYGLDCMKYDEKGAGILSWEKCTLRKWLNTEFYNTAFSDSEKNLIKMTKIKYNTLTNSEYDLFNPEYKYSFTKDNVFLLSKEDLTNTEYGFSSDDKVDDTARLCEPTEYAIAQNNNSWSDNFFSHIDELTCCNWWLSSMYLDVGGLCMGGHLSGYDVDDIMAVRPALVLNVGQETNKAEAWIAKPEQPVITVTAAKYDTTVKVTIKKTSDAEGYCIYMKSESDSKYKKVKTLKKDGSEVRSATITGLSAGKYSFKVRAYSKGAGKTVWGSYSKDKTITLTTVFTDRSEFIKAKTGDVIVFGSYEQDNNKKNGKEAIEWLVLSNDGKELFIVSRYALDWKWYNNNKCENITWEKCSLRKWLNNDFYNAAFSASDKKLIKTTNLKNNEIIDFEMKGGNDTKDNVFLLSLEDMVNTKYGFSSDFDEPDIVRRCAPTAYAVEQGAYFDDEEETLNNEYACDWWLRSPGDHGDRATIVSSPGYVFTVGYLVCDFFDEDDGAIGVRPALVLNLNP